jgi:hypothetical protein
MAAWEWRPFGDERSVATDERQYEWYYGGERFEWEMDLPRAVYDIHGRRPRVYDYGAYVADEVTQDLFGNFCATLASVADERDFDQRERATLVARFVQSLPYTKDEISTEYSSYPRYPIETLVDETGDCKDASLLLAALLFGLDYDVAIARFSDHVGVVVHVPAAPGNVEIDGREYSYIEATSPGWDIGQLPPKYENASVELARIGDSSALYGRWRVEAGDEGVSGSGVVTNRGMGVAENVEFRVMLETDDGRTVAGAGGDWGRIEPGEAVKWSTTGAIDGDGWAHLTPRWLLTDGERPHDYGKAARKRL